MYILYLIKHVNYLYHLTLNPHTKPEMEAIVPFSDRFIFTGCSIM